MKHILMSLLATFIPWSWAVIAWALVVIAVRGTSVASSLWKR
jgi:hypothetical protein